MTNANTNDYSMLYNFGDFSDIINSTEFQEIMKSMQYVGFNPKHTRELLSDYQPDQVELEKDIRAMISLYLNMGNNINTIVKKSSGRDYTLRNILKIQYKLVSHTNQSNPNSAITLSRVANSYPQVVAEVLTSTLISRPFSLEEIREIVPDFPVVLMCSSVAGLIPNQETDKDIAKNFNIVKDAIILYCGYETRKMKNDFKTQPLKDSMLDAEKYVNLSHATIIVSSEERKAAVDSDLFDEVFIDRVNYMPTEAVTSASKKLKEIID